MRQVAEPLSGYPSRGRRWLVVSALVLLASVAPGTAAAFNLRSSPPGNRLTMNLNLSTTTFQTAYGPHSFASLAQTALTYWNTVGIGPTQDHAFFSVRTPTVAGDPCSRDGINEVRFATTVCGMAWPTGVIGMTVWRSIGGRVVETDVLFNQNVSWNAYPDAARGAGGFDFLRIATHEFGHAAGLNHPDDIGQNVVAVMNSGFAARVADSIQADDIAGARVIGWTPIVSPGPPGWPTAPTALAAQCSGDGTQATLSWNPLGGATAYALRMNYPANDGPGCADAWYCSDPPDKILNSYGATIYVARIVPNQPYHVWVHGMQGQQPGTAAALSFRCPAPPAPGLAAPANLVAQCSADGTQATLSWTPLEATTLYAVRINDTANDAPGCADGWYCSDPPDAIVDNFGAASYVARVVPDAAYDAWVHPVHGAVYGPAAGIRFTCPASTPPWPAAPLDLRADCSVDGTEATLSWSGVAGATAYALRVNDESNDQPTCTDGWYCADPVDTIADDYRGTTYRARVSPNRPYHFWVHGVRDGRHGSATGRSFTCAASPPR